MNQSESNPAESSHPSLSQPVSSEEAVTPKAAAARDAAAAATPAAGKRYTSDTITVTFDGARCIHAAECVRGLPAVFDTRRRPWILPTAATAEEIAAVIERCPTGALHYVRSDGGPAEEPDARNTLGVQARGPYYTRGKLRVLTAQGELYLQDVRIALCRCGQSQYKPFCDNSHIAAGFDDPGTVTANTEDTEDAKTGTPEHGELSIKLRPNGPLRLEGDFELISADRQSIYRGSATTLCRCGGSANKPFCDGSHRHNGFQG
jgi:CDGSH-type Zn-finger protein/uncharacterized Fe-S cluster protein YjdI